MPLYSIESTLLSTTTIYLINILIIISYTLYTKVVSNYIISIKRVYIYPLYLVGILY